jgi:hypothetical protein
MKGRRKVNPVEAGAFISSRRKANTAAEIKPIIPRSQ